MKLFLNFLWQCARAFVVAAAFAGLGLAAITVAAILRGDA